MVGPLIYTLHTQSYSMALLLFIIAGFSDALDGFLAKRYNWTSYWGAILDPIADKFMLVSCYLMMGYHAVIPLWVVAAVILRDVFIVVGALIYHFRIEPLNADPLIISKMNTFFQIMLVMFILLDLGFYAINDSIIQILIWIVMMTTLWSGFAYAWIWGKRAVNKCR